MNINLRRKSDGSDMGTLKKKKFYDAEGLLSILPVILIIIIIKGYPLMISFLKSFTNWDGMSKNKFIGLSNYVNILSSSEFWSLLKNNIIILMYIPIQLFVGFVVAVLLYEEVMGWKFFRAVFYLPQIISTVVVGYLFAVFFGYEGPINILLRLLNLNSIAVEWLGNASTALIIIVLCLVWVNIGWQGILVLGGMSSVSPSIFDAAKIDGANYWQRLFNIIIPMLSRVIEYSCIVSVIWTFTGLFPFIYTLTNGGPGYETTTIDYMIYLKAFVTGSQLGYASAISVIMLIIVLVFTKVQMTFADRASDWSE